MLRTASKPVTSLVTRRAALCKRSRSFQQAFTSKSRQSAEPSRLVWSTAAALVLATAYASYTRLRPSGALQADTGSSGTTSTNKIAYQLQTNDAPEENDAAEDGTVITMAEVQRHHLAQDAWVVVDGRVYDVSDYHKFHPGGSQIIVQNAGTDVTELFRSIHPPNTLEHNLTPSCLKGVIDPKEAAASRAAYEAEQRKTAEGRAALPDVETILSLDDMEAAAESFLPKRAAIYYASASLDEFTKQDNRDAFRKCRLLPRILRNVRAIEPQTRIFGLASALPIYISPSSNALLGHPNGELNMVRGAAKTGIVQGVSAAASFSLADILSGKQEVEAELGHGMGMVYQVYFQLDRDKTRAQVKEAIEGGCQALILTVDSCVGDLRQSASKFNGARGDASPGVRMDPITQCPPYHDPTLNWGDHLQELKRLAGDVPIYLKGVCQADDVRLALQEGLAGCILSNHGGRQLDHARTGFDSLRAIHAEDPTLADKIELYVDGGVRRGSDVLQALAFGAKGVGLGRPFLYAQAAYGEEGVIRAIRIMEDEIVTAMRLLGVTRLDQVTPRMVECLQELWK